MIPESFWELIAAAQTSAAESRVVREEAREAIDRAHVVCEHAREARGEAEQIRGGGR